MPTVHCLKNVHRQKSLAKSKKMVKSELSSKGFIFHSLSSIGKRPSEMRLEKAHKKGFKSFLIWIGKNNWTDDPILSLWVCFFIGLLLSPYHPNRDISDAVKLDFLIRHGVWKSQKKSHSTLRAKRATFTFWVDKR